MFTHDRGNPASSTSGDMDIIRLDGEVPTSLPTTESIQYTFETGKITGWCSSRGLIFTGQIYELPDVLFPISTLPPPTARIPAVSRIGRCE